MTRYPDDTSNIGYLDRPCRTEDQYWRERYDELLAASHKIQDAGDVLMTELRKTAQMAFPSTAGRGAGQYMAFMTAWEDRLKDAWNETIVAELADAKDKMEGN